MADFYKHQRRRLNILMEDGSPAGGQWSFDHQNRKKVPKRMLGSIPSLLFQRWVRLSVMPEPMFLRSTPTTLAALTSSFIRQIMLQQQLGSRNS